MYQGGFSLQYSQRLFLCIFQLFQQLDSTKFIFRTFHPWMKTTSCVTDVRKEGGREGGSLGLRNSPFLAPSQRIDASQQTVREARRLKMGTIWFSSDCEHNLTRTQRALQATPFASSQPCEVTNEATPSHQQITLGNSHTTQSHVHRFLARSLVFLNWG